jgi:hypothetical protein
MAEAPDTRPGKRRPRSPDERGARPRYSFRARLRRDPFLFLLCLLFLVFTTCAFAVTWRLLGDPVLLALAILSVPPAFLLFYLRDSSAA